MIKRMGLLHGSQTKIRCRGLYDQDEKMMQGKIRPSKRHGLGRCG